MVAGILYADPVLVVCYGQGQKWVMFVLDLHLNNSVWKAIHPPRFYIIGQGSFLWGNEFICGGTKHQGDYRIYSSSVSFLLLCARTVFVCALICMHRVVPRTDLTLGYLLSPLASLSHTEWGVMSGTGSPSSKRYKPCIMDPHVSKQDPMTFWTNGEGSREKFPQLGKGGKKRKPVFILLLHQDVIGVPVGGM